MPGRRKSGGLSWGERAVSLRARGVQGKDRECVVLSMVRSNAAGCAGALWCDEARLNVALTRAKVSTHSGPGPSLAQAPAPDALPGASVSGKHGHCSLRSVKKRLIPVAFGHGSSPVCLLPVCRGSCSLWALRPPSPADHGRANLSSSWSVETETRCTSPCCSQPWPQESLCCPPEAGRACGRYWYVSGMCIMLLP